MSSSTPDQVLRYKGFSVAIGAAVGGLVVGSVLGFTGAVDLVGEGAPAALAAEASFYECGFEEPSGGLISGDRVYATGRDANGDWIEIRSPHDSNARVWIRAVQLTPDAELALLPVVPCDEPATAIVETDETTTTTVADTTTTTTVVTTTTTTIPPTTTTVPATTTTVPAAPTVGAITEEHDPIWEKYPAYPDSCLGSPNTPVTSLISAPVTAPAGIDSVVMLWSVGGTSGQVTMTLSGGQYRATLGPFSADDPSPVPQNESLPITVTVRVTDDLGRTANRNTTVTLNDCTFF